MDTGFICKRQRDDVDRYFVILYQLYGILRDNARRKTLCRFQRPPRGPYLLVVATKFPYTSLVNTALIIHLRMAFILFFADVLCHTTLAVLLHETNSPSQEQ